MACKPSLLLLGSRGFVGLQLFDKLSSIFNVFCDNHHRLEVLLSADFVRQNNITAVVNCIGSHKEPSSFFHSNLYLPVFLASHFAKISQHLTFDFIFINLSSVGISSPYSTFSLDVPSFSPLMRSYISLNQYEFSKLACETALSFLNYPPNFHVISLLASNVIAGNSLPLTFLFGAFALPLRLDRKRKIPLSTIPLFARLISFIIYHPQNFSESYCTLPAYKRFSITHFFPSLYFSPFKPSLSINSLKLFSSLKNLPLLSRFYRLYIYLFVL